MKILETTRLIIRQLSLDDIQRLTPIFGDAEVMKYSLKGALNETEIVEYVQKILSHYTQHGYGLWGLEHKETGAIVGIAGLIQQLVEGTPFVELGYRLAKKYWKQGFATEAAQAITAYAFNTLDCNQIISIIDPKNVDSIQVAQRVGMRKLQSAKFHQFTVDIYSIDKIVLLPYDPLWQTQYTQEQHILQDIFSQFPIQFHHIGSTSIPGCSAKPIIDILGVTHDILQIDAFNKALEKAHFIPRGEYGMKQRRFFQKRVFPFVNLHIFEDSDPETSRHLRFRDYLIEHPSEIQKYSDIKKKLSIEHASDIMRYILGKESFIKNIDYLAIKQDTGKYWQKNIISRKTNWSDEELICAMEANMHLHMTYFAKYLPIMQIRYEPDITIVTSDIADDTFNYAIGAQFEEKYASQRIAHVLHLFNTPFSWWVSERDTPHALRSLLENHGLSAKEDDIGMYLSLNNHSFTRTNTALSINRIFTESSIQDFADVMIAIGGYPHIYEEFFKKIPPSLYGEQAPLEIYVGYINSVPVVTGIAVFHANVAGLYYIMTRPEYRRQGYGTEMMIALLIRAKNRGYHIATLQASSSGRSLYQKLGFASLCRFVEYKT